ncbi:UDP-N-acetyl-D-mannosamine dehydrogenase [Alloalcanivorax xenomutans]|uniref:UDP-N-acetyl-D-mannosamine dehydrogenase n=1 Tax=Alloalcanivorax xenomutans TaxID=1094342 RepID=A0A9Q3W3H0_9GAMM|nr:UDP-N-acetyl-D-mannosamine dehydrogenase [Alloalcanivorax xenomutans]MCE7507667.1 UDP-N-acetyl-D-mannosamine dehydrogenase [Alloalcanivorax xenomutans]
MNFDTICVVGLGYIGLPTATMFASRRKKVIGVDVNQHAVDTINRGEIHIVEPELDIAVHAAVKEGYLRATTRPEPADAFLVAVPTPFKKGQKEDEIPTPDLSYIQSAADSIAPMLKKGNLVILESTSPVGATEKMADWLSNARPDLTFPQQAGDQADIMIAHCPERVLPGRIMHELIENDRIVGGMTEHSGRAACDLYKTFVRGECLLTNARTAEMAKLTENAFRDVNIAFANELSMICADVNIDVRELISLANKHPRVNILQPGPGVGGHCIAVDPWFIISANSNLARVMFQARSVNNYKRVWVKERLVEEISKRNYKKVLFCGLTYKANIDDVRSSPALDIVKEIASSGVCIVAVYEPNLFELPESIDGLDIDWVRDIRDVSEYDQVFVLVSHDECKYYLNDKSNVAWWS